MGNIRIGGLDAKPVEYGMNCAGIIDGALESTFEIISDLNPLVDLEFDATTHTIARSTTCTTWRPVRNTPTNSRPARGCKNAARNSYGGGDGADDRRERQCALPMQNTDILRDDRGRH